MLNLNTIHYIISTKQHVNKNTEEQKKMPTNYFDAQSLNKKTSVIGEVMILKMDLDRKFLQSHIQDCTKTNTPPVFERLML